jgi:hypothetical protein
MAQRFEEIIHRLLFAAGTDSLAKTHLMSATQVLLKALGKDRQRCRRDNDRAAFGGQDLVILPGQAVVAIHDEYAGENQYRRQDRDDRELVAEEVVPYLLPDDEGKRAEYACDPEPVA